MPPRKDGSYPPKYDPFKHQRPVADLLPEFHPNNASQETSLLVEWAWSVPTTPREKMVLVAIAAHPLVLQPKLIDLVCMTPNATLEAVRELCWAELVTAVEGDALAVVKAFA